MGDEANNLRALWWWPLAIIAAGLFVWGCMFALGAYLDLGGERTDDDNARGVQKGLIVLGCTLGFLAFWGLALWNRSRRLRRNAEVQESGEA